MSSHGPVRALIELLYPPTCVLCGAPGTAGFDLCAGCRADLPPIEPCCARCALPFVAGTPGDVRLCGRCQRRPPPYAVCRVPFRYQDALPYMIGGLKFRARFNVIRLLGGLLADWLPTQPGWRLPDRLVPVPLHPGRLRQRGYNQALETARILARRWALPLDPGCCERRLATPPQTSLERAARLRNLRGAFRATRPLTGERIALLDDVVTTGTTVTELTRVLRRAGAAEVEVWALARTP